MSKHNVERFLEAQDFGNPTLYELALSELLSGRKDSHWIWFILPCHINLAKSDWSLFFGIRTKEEFDEYLKNYTLRQRYFRILELIHAKTDNYNDLVYLMGGEIDALKVISSLTLFSYSEEPIFLELLTKFGDRCEKTLRITEGWMF